MLHSRRREGISAFISGRRYLTHHRPLPGRRPWRATIAVTMPLALPLGAWALIGATFLASAVESVEALTIILAVGVTRGWRSTLLGVGAALLALAALVAALGPSIA